MVYEIIPFLFVLILVLSISLIALYLKCKIGGICMFPSWDFSNIVICGIALRKKKENERGLIEEPQTAFSLLAFIPYGVIVFLAYHRLLWIPLTGAFYRFDNCGKWWSLMASMNTWTGETILLRLICSLNAGYYLMKIWRLKFYSFFNGNVNFRMFGNTGNSYLL